MVLTIESAFCIIRIAGLRYSDITEIKKEYSLYQFPAVLAHLLLIQAVFPAY